MLILVKKIVSKFRNRMRKKTSLNFRFDDFKKFNSSLNSETDSENGQPRGSR